MYHGFSLDFPNESKKYYNIADADADEQWNNWGKDPEDCYIRKYNTSYYRDREDYLHVIIIVSYVMQIFC